jgi:membrane fusion protein (multidrug efflux system)
MRRAQSEGQVTLAEQDKAAVVVTLPDGSPYGEPGTLDFSAATVNPATGSVNLRATVPNPQHSLLPGMYVTLKASLGEQHNVFLVPQQALQRDTAGAFVFTVGADGKVARNNVTTAHMVRGDWVITSGLKAGDQIVVSGIQNVTEGGSAKPTPWHRAPPRNASAAQTPGHTGPSGK